MCEYVMKRQILCSLTALFVGLCAAGAQAVDVGISMSDATTARGIALTQNIVSGLETAGMSVHMMDAGGRMSQQVSDIDTLIAEEPSYLVVSCVRSLGLGEVIGRAAQAGIKVILADQYASDVREDDVYAQAGVNWNWAAQSCVEALTGSAGTGPLSILEITGAPGSSITNELSGSFRRSLDDIEDANIAGVLNGGGDRQTANQELSRFIAEKGLCFSAIFAHGDEQALGAINALMNLPDTDELPVVCVGGMDDARRALQAGRLYACAALETDYGSVILQMIEADRSGSDAPQDVSFEGIMLFADEQEGR